MLKIFEGKKGYKSASLEGVIYHSVYDPYIEAQRFIDSSISSKSDEQRLFIVLGSGLGYIEEEVSRRWPHSKIISIPNDIVWHRHRFSRPKNCYCYMYDCSLTSFLDQYVFDYELGKIELLIWPLDQERNARFKQTIMIFLTKLQSSCRTVASFGGRWFKNAFANYLRVAKIAEIGEIKTVFIASSGPSLIESLPILKSMRDRFFLIALPSSISFLNYHRIRIDMVVSIDGGYYARLHLASLSDDVIMATTLIAQTQSSLSHYFFSFGTPIEKILLPGAPIVKWAGTVAATAIDLALQLTEGDIYLAGQDFSDSNLLIHTKPHTFDSLYMSMSDRLNPLVTILQRLNFSTSMFHYAEWFRAQLWPSRLKRLSPSNIDIAINNILITELLGGYDISCPHVSYRSNKTNTTIINEIFKNWMKLTDENRGDNHEKMLLSFYLDTYNYLKGDITDFKRRLLNLEQYVNRLIASRQNSQ